MDAFVVAVATNPYAQFFAIVGSVITVATTLIFVGKQLWQYLVYARGVFFNGLRSTRFKINLFVARQVREDSVNRFGVFVSTGFLFFKFFTNLAIFQISIIFGVVYITSSNLTIDLNTAGIITKEVAGVRFFLFRIALPVIATLSALAVYISAFNLVIYLKWLRRLGSRHSTISKS